jgi:hypothetical protein
MSGHRIAVVALLAFSLSSGASARAQLPGSGGRGTSMGIGRSPGRDDPTLKEIAPELELRLANGVNIIVAHAKDLSLTSDQLARAIVIKRRLDSLNTPLMRELDSLERAGRQRPEPFHSKGDLPDERNPALDRTLDALRANMRAAEEDAYEVLSGTQLQQALQMIKEARTNAALTVGRDKAPR